MAVRRRSKQAGSMVASRRLRRRDGRRLCIWWVVGWVGSPLLYLLPAPLLLLAVAARGSIVWGLLCGFGWGWGGEQGWGYGKGGAPSLSSHGLCVGMQWCGVVWWWWKGWGGVRSGASFRALPPCRCFFFSCVCCGRRGFVFGAQAAKGTPRRACPLDLGAVGPCRPGRKHLPPQIWGLFSSRCLCAKPLCSKHSTHTFRWGWDALATQTPRPVLPT